MSSVARSAPPGERGHGEGGVGGIGGVVAEIAADVKVAHSVFALPFALLSAVLAVATIPGTGVWSATVALVLVVVVMVSARTAAMLANRLLDRRIDARNPRTRDRAIPAGRLSVGAALTALLVCAAAYFAACAGFGVLVHNWWPLRLALPVLAWLLAYGLLKRFTMLCHFWLGASLAMSPPAAALAVGPEALAHPAPWLLAASVLTWVAGFDIIYALQDQAVDQQEGLHSIPARLGTTRALAVSRWLHAGSAAALGAVWWLEPRLHGMVFGGAVALVALLLVVEHATVRRWGTTRMALTFFTINGCVSLLVGGAGIVSVILG